MLPLSHCLWVLVPQPVSAAIVELDGGATGDSVLLLVNEAYWVFNRTSLAITSTGKGIGRSKDAHNRQLIHTTPGAHGDDGTITGA